MERYYPCTWLSFANQKNEKIRNRNLLLNIISTVPKLLFFKTTDLYTICIHILWICRQLKHHQLRIRSEIFISLEIIVNAFRVWQYQFPLKSLFWLYSHFRLFQLASSVNLLARSVHFNVPSGRRGALYFLREQMYTSGSTFIKKIKSFVCHYISMTR